MAIMCMAPGKLNFLGVFPSSSSRMRSFLLKPAHCAPLQPVQPQGQKINVKSEKNRIYRRCPSCRAIGYTLCSKCKVFKCVTFPNYSDDADLSS
ncbi:uncharacterized protein LOC109009156 isoform X2 [Juglans regia]|uniref:Uncharacterized protein LOC109009156 isoform X2 n=1 Tax=Juglans regia TaxID=51240 RepID=A0A6P9F2X2_JUGRE|nr:uncharacterized protein LOC109009156 isoform X2 [Juglans regia]